MNFSGGGGGGNQAHVLFVCIFGNSRKVAGTGSDNFTCFSEIYCKSGPCGLRFEQAAKVQQFLPAFRLSESASVFSSKRVGFRDPVISLPFRSLQFDGGASYWPPLNTLQQMSDLSSNFVMWFPAGSNAFLHTLVCRSHSQITCSTSR